MINVIVLNLRTCSIYFVEYAEGFPIPTEKRSRQRLRHPDHRKVFSLITVFKSLSPSCCSHLFLLAFTYQRLAVTAIFHSLIRYFREKNRIDFGNSSRKAPPPPPPTKRLQSLGFSTPGKSRPRKLNLVHSSAFDDPHWFVTSHQVSFSYSTYITQ